MHAVTPKEKVMFSSNNEIMMFWKQQVLITGWLEAVINIILNNKAMI